jgi:superfamily II DNA or RNA helicase
MRVLGVTATPWRLDGKPLGEESLFDDHVIAATPRELIADGYLMLATGFEFRKLDTSSVRLQSGEFKMDEAGREASKAEILGDVVGKWLEHARGLRTLVFACNVTHSQALVERFCAAGVRADHLDGSMGNKERDGKLNALREGRIDVLSNCQIATEGLDIPQLECVVLARPTMSTSLALQMVGRVVRTHPGKAVARIHDHAGVLLMHGLPEQERDWSPEVEARQKRKGEPLAKVCPECGHVVTMSTVLCPHCGWEWKKREQTRAEVLEGVSELDLETRRRLEAEERAANALTESLQAARWRELAEEVRCRGYKPAWALIKFREAFPGAEWPPGYAWKKLKSRLAADPGYLRLRQIRDEKGSGNEQAL